MKVARILGLSFSGTLAFGAAVYLTVVVTGRNLLAGAAPPSSVESLERRVLGCYQTPAQSGDRWVLVLEDEGRYQILDRDRSEAGAQPEFAVESGLWRIQAGELWLRADGGSDRHAPVELEAAFDTTGLAIALDGRIFSEFETQRDVLLPEPDHRDRRVLGY